MSNRLAQETSPYLLQHQNNPVDWYPWGPEALTRAKTENKPILLSIGYSACHWCHVMAHECFESDAIAELMNRDFINIKVDREERPDLDHIYQSVAQAITHGGGWPLTVFLTPELIPFYGGTYFPPEDRWGRPGFPKILSGVIRAFREDPEGIARNGERLLGYIRRHEAESDEEPGIAKPSLAGLREAADRLSAYVDWEYGGMGSAPKFPNPSSFTFLWRMGLETGEEKYARAVILTLTHMARRGIFDQLGGGFHRYSVDEKWQVPHFEKMLYDNGLLLELYSEVLASDRLRPILTDAERRLFGATVRKTLDFVVTQMRSPEGLFYSAFDADSEGEEGLYYVWTPAQVEAAVQAGVISAEQAEVFSRYYQITATGNFEHGRTILEPGPDLDAIGQDSLRSAEKALLSWRQRRVPPLCDTKALVAWNALMLSGMVRAALALENTEWVMEAVKTWSALVRTCSRGKGLWSTTKDGQNRSEGFFDDYAFLIRASLDLLDSPRGVESSIRTQIIAKVKDWVEEVRSEFRDEERGAYFFTPRHGEKLITRPKQILDQAIPAGQSLWLESLLLLAEHGAFSGELPQFAREESERMMRDLYAKLVANPFGGSSFLTAALIAERGWVILHLPAQVGETQPEVLGHFRVRWGFGSSEKFQLCHRGLCQEYNSFVALDSEIRNVLQSP